MGAGLIVSGRRIKLERDMLVNEFTRNALAYRKEEREMKRNGFERVGEGGGKLWELQRGGRYNHRITDVRISVDGKSLWIKTAKFDASS